MKLNLLVLRTFDPEILKRQYELLGMCFEYHKHGNGPYHFACELNGFTLEIYPLTKSMTKADANIRLGFDTPNLQQTLNSLKASNWIIKSDIKDTEWGLTAVIQDIDGRKIELKNTK